MLRIYAANPSGEPGFLGPHIGVPVLASGNGQGKEALTAHKPSLFGAQNSSYSGGNGRVSALSSSREEKLVGSHLNLSHPLYRNCRFWSMHPCVWGPHSPPLGMAFLLNSERN